MDDREKDEFDRFRLAARLDRDYELVEKYEEGMRYVWNDIADARYDLGKLDERLGGGS
jgi:hypothetical protein